MVYYAGHGIEVGGVNYLIPVDAKLETDRDASFEAVSLEQVLTAVECREKDQTRGARRLPRQSVCRADAPHRRDPLDRAAGSSRVEPEGATLVVYAAKHGQTALDGDGANCPSPRR